MFLLILLEWKCAAVNLCFLVEMGTTQTQHVLAQIKNGSQAGFVLHNPIPFLPY